MIAVDTNVLVRYLVQDHPAQSRIATQLLENAEAKGIGCYLSDVVLCEMVWVLASCYRHTRHQIVDILRRLLHTGMFSVDDPELVEEAVNVYATGRADFSDYLIVAQSQAVGVKKFYTFDRLLRKHPGVAVL